MTSSIDKGTHCRNFFFLVNFRFHFLLNSEKEKYRNKITIKKNI